MHRVRLVKPWIMDTVRSLTSSAFFFGISFNISFLLSTSNSRIQMQNGTMNIPVSTPNRYYCIPSFNESMMVSAFIPF